MPSWPACIEIVEDQQLMKMTSFEEYMHKMFLGIESHFSCYKCHHTTSLIVHMHIMFTSRSHFELPNVRF